jgi:hypothetical protein
MEQNLDLSTIFKIPSLKKEYNVTNEKDKEATARLVMFK